MFEFEGTEERVTNDGHRYLCYIFQYLEKERVYGHKHYVGFPYMVTTATQHSPKVSKLWHDGTDITSSGKKNTRVIGEGNGNHVIEVSGSCIHSLQPSHVVVAHSPEGLDSRIAASRRGRWPTPVLAVVAT